MPSKSGESGFKVLQQFPSTYSPSTFTLYESKKTGMRVVVVDQKGPKVYGYFTLATEIHDDSGAPHTLEHLCFMGSKSYKYKGLLDKLATRAYSNTNAWTATDHTAYTLDTAGWDGFAQLLPIYLEHVLLPTLTDAGCYTEVHHIDGTGNDAGVVYSEMQALQNTGPELMDLKARRLLYPESVGFRYETGGLMERLRVLTAERIRQFHHDMYKPKNLCLVLIGDIDHDNLLRVLDEFENSIETDVPSIEDPFDRPWQKHGKTPPLQDSVTATIEFPEEDESMGEISICYLGPDWRDDVADVAMTILLNYLCGSSISLLEHTLVESEQLASGVYYSTDNRPDNIIWFSISGVDTDALESVEKRFYEVLLEAASKELDMDYIHDCLNRQIRQIKLMAENSGTLFSESIISDHLFGNRDGSDLVKLGDLRFLESLRAWEEPRWRDFFSKWIAKAHRVSVIGRPSQKLAGKLRSDEEERVKRQREKLGESGLKKLAEKLEEAKAENDKPIPTELLKSFKTPSTDSIHFIPTASARAGIAPRKGDLDDRIQKRVDADKSKVPLFLHLEHIPTNFVAINLVMNTHNVPIELRPLLAIYTSNFFETPVLRNGKRVEYEAVVNQLERDTASYGIQLGAALTNPEVLHVQIQVEPSKYDAAIAWVRDLLFHPIFDVTRLKPTFARILAEIPELKRSGSSMINSIYTMTHYTRESTLRSMDLLVKAVYLKRMAFLLQTEPEAVISNLETVQKNLTDPSNFRFSIHANLETDTLKRPISSWQSFVPNTSAQPRTVKDLDSPKSCLSDAAKLPGTLSTIVPMPTLASSFARFVTKGPDAFDHPDLAALTVALAYLEASEGPLLNAVRGTGLAYDVFFERDVPNGRLAFDIYRSPDAHKAYAASRKTVEDLARGAVPLDEIAFEGAASSIIVALADEQPTMARAASTSFVNQVMLGLPKHWGREFMKRVSKVSMDEVRTALEKIVLPVFVPGKADMVVTCAPIMQEALVERFGKVGFKPEVRTIASFQDDYGLKGPDGDDEDEDEYEMVDGDDEEDDDEDE